MVISLCYSNSCTFFKSIGVSPYWLKNFFLPLSDEHDAFMTKPLNID